MNTEHLPIAELASYPSTSNHRVYETIQPFLKGEILELASRTGDFTEFLIANQKQIRISDPDRDYCQILKEKFIDTRQVISIRHVDPSIRNFDIGYRNLLRKYDTVALLNWAPTISLQPPALINIKKMIKSEGHAILLLPAYTGLYPGWAEGLDQCLQSNQQYLRALFGKQIEILKIQFLHSVHGLLMIAIIKVA